MNQNRTITKVRNNLQSLKNFLSSTEIECDVDDPYNNTLNTEYFSNDEARIFFTDNNETDLSLFYWNVSSLPVHMNDLNNMLAGLKVKPDVIALSETRITEIVNTDYRPYIEGYTFKNIPSKTITGSVGVFWRNSLKIEFREDLCASEKGLYETLWFDIISNSKANKKYTIGVIYRHPCPTEISTFTNHFDGVLQKLN